MKTEAQKNPIHAEIYKLLKNKKFSMDGEDENDDYSDNPDGVMDVFCSGAMTVYVHSDGKLSFTFAWNEDGWYEVKNATFEEIKTLILLYEKAEYRGMFDNPMPRFMQLGLAHMVKEYIDNKHQGKYEPKDDL